jgi:hypothetical protein
VRPVVGDVATRAGPEVDVAAPVARSRNGDRYIAWRDLMRTDA